MQLYYIRHGQSANNASWARSGSDEGRVTDPKLTAIGERQAALVANSLAAAGKAAPRDIIGNGEAVPGYDPQNLGGFPITHCYCSLMERAVATGHRISEALDLPLHTWIDIHETGGMFLQNRETGERMAQPGLARGYLKKTYSRIVLPDSVTDRGWWNRPFEEREERPVRAVRVVAELLERHGNTDDGVIFVSHGGFFNYLLWAILGLSQEGPFDNRPWFVTNNASITRIDFDGERRAVVYMNRADFLPPELIT